jgi:anti-sigma B factor antagonist
LTTTGSASADPHHPHVIHVEGDIDMATASCLTDALDAVIGAALTPSSVVLDMSHLTFIDSMGLSELVRVNETLTSSGRALVLRNVPARAMRLLELTRLDETFTIEPRSADPGPLQATQ